MRRTASFYYFSSQANVFRCGERDWLIDAVLLLWLFLHFCSDAAGAAKAHSRRLKCVLRPIVLRCHSDGQMSGISARAISRGLILITTAVANIRRLTELTDLLLYLFVLWLLLKWNSWDRGWFAQRVENTIPLPVIFERKGRILGRLSLTFQRWIRKLFCPITLLKEEDLCLYLSQTNRHIPGTSFF